MYVGKAQIEMKIGSTLVCTDLKKQVRSLKRKRVGTAVKRLYLKTRERCWNLDLAYLSAYSIIPFQYIYYNGIILF